MIVLDTHTWLWWISNPELLSEPASQVIDKAVREKSVHISSISSWEVAMLVQKGRLQLSMDVRDWVLRSEALPFLTFVPVDNAIAVQSTRLTGELHGDAADRIIIATAQFLGAELVTKDNKIR